MYDKRDGSITYSNPQNPDEDSLANKANINYLKSQLIVQYYNADVRSSNYDSYSQSVAGCGAHSNRHTLSCRLPEWIPEAYRPPDGIPAALPHKCETAGVRYLPDGQKHAGYRGGWCDHRIDYGGSFRQVDE